MVRYVQNLPGVGSMCVDRCRFGSSVSGDGTLSKKPTRLMSNCDAFLDRFAGSRCTGDHWHAHLIGSSMTARSRVYPPKFARAFAEAVRASTNAAISGTSPGQIRVAREAGGPELYLAESYPADVEEGEALEGDPDPEGVAQDRPFEITPKVRRLIHKMHVNLGHPHKDVFLKVLRGAQAKPEVLKFVQDE
eukprot:6811026-Pyramimonas_sp.AAC.1